jgi:uncharacterized protein (DUF427 family)
MEGHMAQAVEAPGWVAVEPSPRRVRAVFADQTIADSKRVMLFRQRGSTPVYYFPRADVRSELLVATEATREDPLKGEAQLWNVVVGNKVADQAAIIYAEGLDQWPDRADYIAFEWDKMDHWFEEAEEVIRHARDPYHRVDVAQSDRHIKVVVGDEVLAETARAKILWETGIPTRYYIPTDDVRMELLEPTDLHTRCPYKGEASYWKLKGANEAGSEIAWAYLDPLPECPKIKGLISFYNERVDALYVDGQAEPKPLRRWHAIPARIP